MSIQFRHGAVGSVANNFWELRCRPRFGHGLHQIGIIFMDYSRACELLGFTTPKSLRDNAELAKSRLRSYQGNQVALRYLVACDVLIKADQECN